MYHFIKNILHTVQYSSIYIQTIFGSKERTAPFIFHIFHLGVGTLRQLQLTKYIGRLDGGYLEQTGWITSRNLDSGGRQPCLGVGTGGGPTKEVGGVGVLPIGFLLFVLLSPLTVETLSLRVSQLTV